MREYRSALEATKLDAQLAEEEARQATALLCESESEQYVAPEVPRLIQEHLDAETSADLEAGRKRAYDVAALLNAAGAQLFSLLALLPKLESAAAAAVSLKNRFWSLLRVILEWAGLL